MTKVEIERVSETRWLIRRHGLTWNFYSFVHGTSLFWPNNSVSHPVSLGEAISQVSETPSRWFDTKPLWGRRTFWEQQKIYDNCDCEDRFHISCY